MTYVENNDTKLGITKGFYTTNQGVNFKRG